MKLVILALCMFALAVQASKDYEILLKQCMEESDIKEEEFEEMAEHGDIKMRCFMACLMEKTGVLIDGKLDKEAMKKDLLEDFPDVGDNKVNEIIEECFDLGKDISEMCAMSNMIGICIKDKLEDMGIPIGKLA